MIKKVLLASDGSEDALRAASFTKGILEEIDGARATVLVVDDLREKIKSSSPMYEPIIPEGVAETLEKEIQESLIKTLEVFEDKLKLRVEAVMKEGNPAQEILLLAEEGKYDLIVIGGRGMGVLKGILLGSVSTKVIHLASCPVTVVK